MVELTPIFMATGILSVIWVGFGTLIGILFLKKYFTYNYRPMLLWGLCWINLMKFWWPYAINFLLILTTGEILSLKITILIAETTTPIHFILWMAAWADIMYEHHFKSIISILIIYGIISQIIFWSLFFTDLGLILKLNSPFDYTFVGIIQILMFGETIVFLISAIFLYLRGHISLDPKIRIKSMLFLIHALTFFSGVMLDIGFSNFITIMISRIVMMFAPLCLYISQTYPEKMERFLLNKK
ncbi:MAG: hypothetical protein ACFFDK_13115 [Promethearchaeota archaeon]